MKRIYSFSKQNGQKLARNSSAGWAITMLMGLTNHLSYRPNCFIRIEVLISVHVGPLGLV